MILRLLLFFMICAANEMRHSLLAFKSTKQNCEKSLTETFGNRCFYAIVVVMGFLGLQQFFSEKQSVGVHEISFHPKLYKS